MIRITALLAVAATALVGVASLGAAPSVPKKLTGSVGPGETIVLKKGSVRASTIPRGRYTIVVSDRSSEHNFHLRGPVGKVITSVSLDRDEDRHAEPEARSLHLRVRPALAGHDRELRVR